MAETLSLLAMQALNGGGGGGNTPIMVGVVSNGDSMPTHRPDGSPFVLGDFVRAKTTATFPFTVSGLTFNSVKDTAVWMGTEWQMNTTAFQYTSETPLKTKATESLSGNADYQSNANIEFVNIIGKNQTLDVASKTNIIEALNYVWVECKKAGYTFTITETDNDSLRSIVFNVKDKDNNVLINKTLADFVLKTRKVAGLDLVDDITAQEIQDAIKDLTATLTHKTISADDNIITELETDNFKNGVILTVANTGTGGTDTTLLTEKATIDLFDKAGHSLGLSLSGKVLTIQLKDNDNNVLDTKTVDIEFIKSITWDDTTSKLTLTKSDDTTSEVELTKVVITDKAQTLTNKTVDVDDNTVSNIETDNFKASALAQSTDNVRDYAKWKYNLSLTNNYLAVNFNTNKSLWRVLEENDDIEIKVNPVSVYRGNSENKGIKQQAYIYNGGWQQL